MCDLKFHCIQHVTRLQTQLDDLRAKCDQLSSQVKESKSQQVLCSLPFHVRMESNLNSQFTTGISNYSHGSTGCISTARPLDLPCRLTSLSCAVHTHGARHTCWPGHRPRCSRLTLRNKYVAVISYHCVSSHFTLVALQALNLVLYGYSIPVCFIDSFLCLLRRQPRSCWQHCGAH